PGVVVSDASVGAVGVGVDRLGVVSDYIFEEALDVLTLGSRENADAELAATLARANHDGLVREPLPCDLLAAPVAARQLPADVSLIGLHDPGQQRCALDLHRSANAVAEIPGGLVGHAEHPLQLVRAHPLLGLAENEDREEPLPQRQVRVVEDRPRLGAELVAAGVTVELPALLDPADFVRVATRTTDTVRPAQLLEEGEAGVLVTELVDQFCEVH